MKVRKFLFLSIASVSLLATTVPAAATTAASATNIKRQLQLKLKKNTYVYNAEGVQLKPIKKGVKVTILDKKVIDGQDFYRIAKNKYVKPANITIIGKKYSTQAKIAAINKLLAFQKQNPSKTISSSLQPISQ
ncbi:SLAP domain-containing protein [Lactobacillus sp. ESL0791]|uniref:SLAP domain-containing protein n=1 Tax=Lactobacillus sp. ESL0791 TaxID=2983234 RepID=UPI0023F6790B|nr:SLAP domain-containing protein [Lactobacillus sp. ESL0791]MDF7639522.1 SLAP domain-containing protein [Lactobacillus sp. ESL0791]